MQITNQEAAFEQTKSAHSSELVYSLGENDASAASMNGQNPNIILTDEKTEAQNHSDAKNSRSPQLDVGLSSNNRAIHASDGNSRLANPFPQ